jgi:hypothetical protein
MHGKDYRASSAVSNRNYEQACSQTRKIAYCGEEVFTINVFKDI